MPFGLPKTRVVLFGAGFIAPIHVSALKRCRWIEIAGVHDLDPERTRRFAETHGIRAIDEPIDAWLARGEADVAHVIVPPDAHVDVARKCLEAGLHVIVEKPIALTSADARELAALAERKGKRIGVNHNMVFHPAVSGLRHDLDRERLGRLEHVAIVHNVPLRQLGTGDVGHFMFRREANILFEQAVHPFSILYELLGPCRDVVAQTQRRTLANGRPFLDRWQLSMQCERGTAQVLLAFGQDHLETTLHAIGTDGSSRIDYERNTSLRTNKTRWLDPFDAAMNGLRGGATVMLQGAASAINYVLSLAKIRGTTDPYMAGMERSLIAFHKALRDQRPLPCDASAAAEVLEYCEKTADAANATAPEPPRPELPEPGPARDGEIVVTGGAGFVGRNVVKQLLDAGRPVTVLVRNPVKMPTMLRDDRIRLVAGDAADPDALDRAFAGADAVIHLATCMADDPAAIEREMANATRTVAQACKKHDIRRLVFASTSAALWLGDGGSITGEAPPDPKPETRGAYSRGKIASEAVLREEEARGLRHVIVRPAIVVGKGGAPEHSGVGLWVRDNHCVGWGRGDNPLPFVLARDVASALIGAADADGIDGKAYNLAGDVRMSAKKYVRELRACTQRDYRYHPTPTWFMQGIEIFKWLVKKAIRRRGAAFPSYRDFKSRGFFTALDTSDAKRDLGWTPESDRDTFIDEAIAIHAPARSSSADAAPERNANRDGTGNDASSAQPAAVSDDAAAPADSRR